jgi:hypothetical protein
VARIIHINDSVVITDIIETRNHDKVYRFCGNWGIVKKRGKRKYRGASEMKVAEPILTQSRAAVLAGVPLTALRRYVTAGRVASVKIGNCKRVRLSAVLAFLVECPAVWARVDL